jgi:hypothetical protein
MMVRDTPIVRRREDRFMAAPIIRARHTSTKIRDGGQGRKPW